MSLTHRQLALRRDKIGASEIAALAGLSKWASPIQVYEAKVEGATKETTLAMELGHLLEEPVATLYARRTKSWLRVVHSLHSEAHPLAIATPDRAVFPARVAELAASKKLGLAQFREAERGLECKTTGWRERARWGEEGTDQVPDEHAIQCLWGMGVTGLREWDLACLIDREEFLVYHLAFDAELFGNLYEIGARFMVDHVFARRPPPPDASKHYAQFLDRLWPSNQVDLLPVDDLAVEVLAVELAKLSDVEKRVKAAKLIRQNALKAKIGDAGGLQSLSFGKIYWRRNRARKELDAAAAVQELTLLGGLLVNALPEGDQKNQLAEQLRTVRERHTFEVPGTRALRPFWSKALQANLGSLGETLAQLERQTPVVDEEEEQDPADGGTVAEEQTGEVQP